MLELCNIFCHNGMLRKSLRYRFSAYLTVCAKESLSRALPFLTESIFNKTSPTLMRCASMQGRARPNALHCITARLLKLVHRIYVPIGKKSY